MWLRGVGKVIEVLLGNIQVILEISDTLLTVNEDDPAPAPTPPYTFVEKVYTAGGKDYYIQQRIKDGTFTPV